MSKEFNDRWQVDLINFRSINDGSYKYNWIMNVQDHHTKFCMLEALTEKSGVNVAKVLYKLFGIFGSPKILQSDNGKEFRNQIITALKSI